MISVNVLKELQEYIITEDTSPCTSFSSNIEAKLEHKWSENESKILIDLYFKYHKKIGTLQIKTTKMLWQKICEELEKLNIKVTPNNCLNRWRVLERNYKKFIDNKNKTGRGRKYFEYEKEMDEIFGKKRNVHPEILLTSEAIDNKLSDQIKDGVVATETNENEDSGTATIQKTSVTATAAKRARVVNKKTVIENIRLDRKSYYEERLKIERDKVEESRKRNKLIEERNLIIKEQFKCNNCQNCFLLNNP